MSKSIIIVGAVEGVSGATARNFGKEGFSVGLISRDPDKIRTLVEELNANGIFVFTANAEVANTNQLKIAIDRLKSQLGKISTCSIMPHLKKKKIFWKRMQLRY